MKTAALIYPHQLFARHPALQLAEIVVLIEEPLFFSQYNFHRQKLMLHRASMRRYQAELIAEGRTVTYVEARDLNHTGDVIGVLQRLGIDAAVYCELNDDWLGRRLSAALRSASIKEVVLSDPHFLTPLSAIEEFTEGKERFFFTEFYIGQRKRLGILLDERRKPLGGKWSFDPENRKRLPKGTRAPIPAFPAEDEFVREARSYVHARFPDAVGEDAPFRYPTSHAAAAAWLNDFIEHRLSCFGDYEDAMSAEQAVLFHSLLTPSLNIGLISPQQAIECALDSKAPLNSLEGFVRQIIGWREFVRLIYKTQGRQQRIGNFFNAKAEIPAGFYSATTGIEPIDHTIRQVLKTGYCHHIERLMLLGNFMLLCDISPHSVYRWFMELFIDSYDWVMVPNVYGMSQYADGGMMTTKPYISGSSYVLKMSDFAKGSWCPIWDALYWRFIDRNEQFFASNQRMAVMVSMRNKLGDKMTEHRRVAEGFLTAMHGG